MKGGGDPLVAVFCCKPDLIRPKKRGVIRFMATSPASSAIPTYQEVIRAINNYTQFSITPVTIFDSNSVYTLNADISLFEFDTDTAAGKFLTFLIPMGDTFIAHPYKEMYFYGSGYNCRGITLQFEEASDNSTHVKPDMFKYNNTILLNDGGPWVAYIKYGIIDEATVFCFGFTYSQYGYADDTIGIKFFCKIEQTYYNCSRI